MSNRIKDALIFISIVIFSSTILGEKNEGEKPIKNPSYETPDTNSANELKDLRERIEMLEDSINAKIEEKNKEKERRERQKEKERREEYKEKMKDYEERLPDMERWKQDIFLNETRNAYVISIKRKDLNEQKFKLNMLAKRLKTHKKFKNKDKV